MDQEEAAEAAAVEASEEALAADLAEVDSEARAAAEAVAVAASVAALAADSAAAPTDLIDPTGIITTITTASGSSAPVITDTVDFSVDSSAYLCFPSFL